MFGNELRSLLYGKMAILFALVVALGLFLFTGFSAMGAERGCGGDGGDARF